MVDLQITGNPYHCRFEEISRSSKGLVAFSSYILQICHICHIRKAQKVSGRGGGIRS